MIKKIHLKNFFSFKEQEISLQDNNFVIGINGSGKSNFLKAFQILKATITEGELENLIVNKWGGFDAIHYSGNTDERNPMFALDFEFDEEVLSKYGYHFVEPIFYEMAIYKVAGTQNFTIKECLATRTADIRPKHKYVYLQANRGKGMAKEGDPSSQHNVEYVLENSSDSMLSQLVDKDRYYQIYTVRRAIADIAIYTYFDTTERSPIRRPAMPAGISKLLPDGGNLPQLLNWIKINNKTDYRKLSESLHAVNPMISGFDFNPLGANIELLLEEDKLNRSVHVTHVSDGTLRFLCLMSIIHNSKRGSLVIIDEPEVGMHPDMIVELMQAIDTVNESTQFIMTSHSDIVLNQTSVDKILVFEKDEDNSTEVTTFKDEEFVKWASDYSVGNLWRNGDLGGNRF